MSTWVVAADSSRARILSAEKRAGQLVELEAMVHPEARLHGQELLSDAPGAAFDSGALGRHAIGGKIDVKQQEAIRFGAGPRPGRRRGGSSFPDPERRGGGGHEFQRLPGGPVRLGPGSE